MPIVDKTPTLEPRAVAPAMKRGWRQRCPACGDGRMFGKFLKVEDQCAVCGTELHHQRADDAPPYFTMFIVAHVVVAGLLILEKRYHPETWVQLSIWLPMTVLLSLWLLPKIKGALIGQQWALRMHGFGKLVPGIDSAEPWIGDAVVEQQRRSQL